MREASKQTAKPAPPEGQANANQTHAPAASTVTKPASAEDWLSPLFERGADMPQPPRSLRLQLTFWGAIACLAALALFVA